MDLVLIKDWNGLRSGFRLVGVPGGQAELLVKRGLAVKAETQDTKTQQPKQSKRQK